MSVAEALLDMHGEDEAAAIQADDGASSPELLGSWDDTSGVGAKLLLGWDDGKDDGRIDKLGMALGCNVGHCDTDGVSEGCKCIALDSGTRNEESEMQYRARNQMCRLRDSNIKIY